MFSEKQIAAYRAVKAPEEVRRAVMAHAVRTKKRSGTFLSRAGALAAAFCLVAALVFAFSPKSGGASLMLGGVAVEENAVFYDASFASEMRSTPSFSLSVDVKTEGETEVSVSRGLLVNAEGEGREEVRSAEDLSLIWVLPKEEEVFSCSLSLQDAAGATLFMLSYDPVQNALRIEKIEKR